MGFVDAPRTWHNETTGAKLYHALVENREGNTTRIFMIDEINYFPKRDNYQKKKKKEDDWNELKKMRQQQETRKKTEKNPSPPSRDPKPEK
jgi:hypothetical protein